MRRYQQAVIEEPERYKDIDPATPNALELLRVYIKNIVGGNPPDKKTDGPEPQKKIDKRNKRFYIQFGDDPDSVELFRYLDFQEVDSGETSAWKVPTPDMQRPTPIGSPFAFFQDIESEIETLIAFKNSEMRPLPATPHLRKALHLDDRYARTKVTGQAYDQWDFDTLGIIPEFHESIFWYAFSCQRQTDPTNEPRYFGALQRLARGRGNEELEMKVQSYDSIRTLPAPVPDDDEEIRRAKEISLRDTDMQANQELATAYASFGFDHMPETEDVLIGKFLAMCDSSPAQKSTHREKLVTIGRVTDNKKLLDIAQDTMDLDEAMAYLGVGRDTEPDFIIATAQWQASVSPSPSCCWI